MVKDKNIVLFIFMLLFVMVLVPMVSAFDFDNTYEYFPEVKTAIVHNCDFWIGFCFNQGEELSRITLTWGDTETGIGIDTHVGTFNYTPLSEDSFLGDLDLYQMGSGNIMSRGKQYKIKTFSTEDKYSNVCEDVVAENSTIIQNCSLIENGTIEVIEWIPIVNPNFNFIIGQTYEIGVFVDTVEGDYGDWIPTVSGLPITEFATWISSLNTNLLAYYKMDEPSGIIQDSTPNGYDSISNTGDYGAIGIIIDAIDYEKTNEDETIFPYYSALELTGDDKTISFWIAPETLSANNRMLCTDDGSDTSSGWCIYYNSQFIVQEISSGNTSHAWNTGATTSTGSYHNIVYAFEKGVQRELFIDGLSVANSTDYNYNLIDDPDNELYIAGVEDWAQHSDGRFDEIAIWNRTLTRDEIVINLWNEGAGNTYSVNNPPTAELGTPTNETEYNTNSLSVDFTCKGIDDTNLDNLTFSIWNMSTGEQLNTQVNTDGQNDTLETFSYTVVGDTNYSWNCLATDNNSQSVYATNNNTIFVYSIPDNAPVVTLNFPPNNTLHITSPQSINFNCSAFDDINLINVSLIFNGAINLTNSSGVNNSDYIFNPSPLNDGNYLWSCQATDNSSQQTLPTARLLIVHGDTPFVDITSPANGSIVTQFNQSITLNWTISDFSLDTCWYNFNGVNNTVTCGDNFTVINYPTSNPSSEIITLYANDTVNRMDSDNITLVKSTDAPDINITSPVTNYATLLGGQSIDLNFTISNVTVLDDCWYNYNGDNTTINCSDGTVTTNFTYVGSINTLTVFSNDTLSNINSSTVTWTAETIELNYTFNSPVVEGSSETIDLYTIVNGTITSANLIYNGTSYPANILALGDGTTKISTTYQVPDFPVDTNATFFMSLGLLTGSTANFTVQTQLVQTLNIGNCTAYNFTILNLSLFDEKTLLPLVGTIEADIIILDNTATVELDSVSTEFYNVSNALVCSNILLNSSGNLYSLELRYYVDPTNNSEFLYAPEFYHIQQGETDNLPQTINLYDLNVNQSTEFSILYRDNNYISRPNVLLQIERKYVSEGIFRTVEIPITSSEGSTTGHFDLNNYKYRITATQFGVVLNVFDNPAIVCESELAGQCTLSLNGKGNPNPYNNINEVNGIAYITTVNGSDVTVTYNIPSGETRTVRVVMQQDSAFASPSTICNQTLTSSSGSITCTVDATIGDSQVFIEVSSGGYLDRAVAFFEESIADDYNLNQYIIAAFLLIALVTMFVSSPKIMVSVAVFGVALLGLLFLLNGSSIGIVVGVISWLIIAGVIILIKISKKDET